MVRALEKLVIAVNEGTLGICADDIGKVVKTADTLPALHALFVRFRGGWVGAETSEMCGGAACWILHGGTQRSHLGPHCITCS